MDEAAHVRQWQRAFRSIPRSLLHPFQQVSIARLLCFMHCRQQPCLPWATWPVCQAVSVYSME
ncbi:hypothetical protein D8I24_5070 [Cupriavidus necator H850]|nr:hypothetical protein D8I24_5070 [Cupriavidus necator H850]